MNTRSRISALFGAAILTMGIAGVALASTDLLAGQVGITLGSKFDAVACEDFPLEIGAGEVGVHFILEGTNDASGLLNATFSSPAGSITDLPDTDSPSAVLHWYAVITGDANTILESASTDATGNNLVLSHACPGATVTAPPTPEVTPTFGLQTGDLTDAPSEPSTDSIGTNGTSAPADGAWLLVVALGVLLASIVVLTPARAKSRR
jgi:hypothetical protein